MTDTLLAVQPANALAHYLKQNESKIELSLSGSLPVDKFLQVSMNAIRENEKLCQCSPGSILSSLLQAAEVRLFPGSTLGHAYLVPYWSNKSKSYTCTYILGYKGMIALCHRSAKILKVEAQTVHEGDEFEVSYGQNGHLTHAPDPWGVRSEGNCLGAYAIAHLANGTYLFERLSRAQLEAVRQRSKSGKNGPWVTDVLAMMRKTAMRKLSTWLPLEPQDAEAIAEEEARDLGHAEPRDVSVEAENPAAELNALLAHADEPDKEGVVLSEAKERLLNDWMASQETDTQAVIEYVRAEYGASHFSEITDAQAKSLVEMLEAGDFTPAD